MILRAGLTLKDLVDRGSWSLEVALTAFAYKWLYPEYVFINRGNHETNGACTHACGWTELTVQT